jgi:hypothetical protein
MVSDEQSDAAMKIDIPFHYPVHEDIRSPASTRWMVDRIRTEIPEYASADVETHVRCGPRSHPLNLVRIAGRLYRSNLMLERQVGVVPGMSGPLVVADPMAGQKCFAPFVPGTSSQTGRLSNSSVLVDEDFAVRLAPPDSSRTRDEIRELHRARAETIMSKLVTVGGMVMDGSCDPLIATSHKTTTMDQWMRSATSWVFVDPLFGWRIGDYRSFGFKDDDAALVDFMPFTMESARNIRDVGTKPGVFDGKLPVDDLGEVPLTGLAVSEMMSFVVSGLVRKVDRSMLGEEARDLLHLASATIADWARFGSPPPPTVEAGDILARLCAMMVSGEDAGLSQCLPWMPARLHVEAFPKRWADEMRDMATMERTVSVGTSVIDHADELADFRF